MPVPPFSMPSVIDAPALGLAGARTLRALYVILGLLVGPLLVVALDPTTATAQTPSELAAVEGTVRNAQTEARLPLANVRLETPESTLRGTATREDGTFTFGDLAPGRYRMVVTYLGFARWERSVVLSAGTTRRVEAALHPVDLEAGELVVTEKRHTRDLESSTVPTALIESLPTAVQPDVFRSLQLLPGVSGSSDYSSSLYVRGGSPDQTLVLLDDAPVYNPTHFLGLFSTFNPDMVRTVRLYKGAYPAEFGERLGSVLAVENTAGSRNGAGGELGLGLLSSRAQVEGPLGPTKNGRAPGSYAVSVRRSTLEPILAALQGSGIDGIPESFHFVDVNAKATYDLGPSDRLTLSLYGGQDGLDLEVMDGVRIDVGYGNRVGSLGWTHRFSDAVVTDLSVSGSRYRSTPVAFIGGTRNRQVNAINEVATKTDLAWTPGPRHDVKAGLKLRSIHLTYREEVDDRQTLRRPMRSEHASLYVQETFRPSTRWTLTGGLRMSHFANGAYWYAQPRASVGYAPSSSLEFRAQYGRHVQPLSRDASELFPGFDTWLMAAEGVRPARSDQMVLGLTAQPGPRWTLDVEGYLRSMHGLFETDPFLPDLAGVPYAQTMHVGDGRAYGGEFLLRRDGDRLQGVLSYTVGRTERRFPGINVGADGAAQYHAPKHDRTHDLTAFARYRLGAWTLSTTFRLATGQAYTEPSFQYSVPGVPFLGKGHSFKVLSSAFNGARLPTYHRLDIGIARTGRLLGLAEYEARLQVANVYGRRNIWFYYFGNEEGFVERTDVPQIPVPLPSFSLALTF